MAKNLELIAVIRPTDLIVEAGADRTDGIETLYANQRESSACEYQIAEAVIALLPDDVLIERIQPNGSDDSDDPASYYHVNAYVAVEDHLKPHLTEAQRELNKALADNNWTLGQIDIHPILASSIRTAKLQAENAPFI